MPAESILVFSFRSLALLRWASLELANEPWPHHSSPQLIIENPILNLDRGVCVQDIMEL